MTHDIRADLIQLLGPKAIVAPERLALTDAGVSPENLHGILAIAPSGAQQISEMFKYCNQTRIPVIPQGGRTGLAMGAAGTGREVLLFTAALPKLIDIDPITQVAQVSASVTLAELEAEANAHSLSAGIDLAARDSATIGGMISTNAGGMEAFRFGTMRQRVLGLEAVMPDGAIFSDLAKVRKCNEGYDIKQLLIGAEGTLGVITAATLQLTPKQPDAATFLLACTDVDAALAVLHRLTATKGLTVQRAEVMWRRFATENAKLHGSEELVNFANGGVYVVFDVDGSDTVQDDFFIAIEEFLDSGGVLNCITAQNAQQARDIWLLREDTFGLQVYYPNAIWFDISVPLGSLASHTQKVIDRLTQLDPAIVVLTMGHLGDGNLHYTIAHPDPIKAPFAALIKAAVMDGLKPLGGSFSAEHGIGLEKRDALENYGDPVKHKLMQQIKNTLDPNNICNPGKVL